MKSISLVVAAVSLGLTGQAHALLSNGSFEESYFADGSTATGTWRGYDLDQVQGGRWDVYNSVPGWTTTQGNGIEVQSNTVVKAQDGNRYVELDSHPGPGSNSTMTQTVATQVGHEYQLDFFYHARPYANSTAASTVTPDGSTNAIGVSFGSERFTVDGAPSDGWVQVTRSFTATSSSTDLSFSALGLAETFGGFVDNVSLSSLGPTSVPELDPNGGASALTLLLGGVAVVLGGRRRRSR